MNVELAVELTSAAAGYQDIMCTISQETPSLVLLTKRMSLEDVVLRVKVPLSQLSGECHLHCDSPSPQRHSWGTHTLTVVDSRTLTVTSVSPLVATVGVTVQWKLVVHGITAPLDLFCFILDSNMTVVDILPTNRVSGNPLASTVVCPPSIPLSDKPQFLGVAFSRAAVANLSANNTVRASSQAAPLIPLQADFAEDSSVIRVEFNQNIEGPADCSRVFRSSTQILLGGGLIGSTMVESSMILGLNGVEDGVKCEYIGNRIYITLGSAAQIHPRDFLRFSAPTSLRPRGSSVPASVQGDAVKLDFRKGVPAHYQVIGPEQLCPPSISTVEVVPLTGPPLLYNWSLTVTEASATEATQRRNLLVWLGARQLISAARHASVQSLQINTSLLVPNIIYHLQVVGYNTKGFVGQPSHLDFQLASPTSHPPVTLAILCSSTVRADSPLMLEARVSSACGNVSVSNTQYLWKVESDTHRMTLEQTGPRATVPAGSLRARSVYNISCVLSLRSVVLATNQMQVLVEHGSIRMEVVPTEISLGTGHSLLLDISYSLRNIDFTTLQFQWTCEREDGLTCIVPGSGQNLSTRYSAALSQPRLVLPAGSLPVGRYRLTAATKLVNTTYSASAVVLMMAGNPPLVHLSHPYLPPSRNSMTFPATVSDIHQGCLITWETLGLVGYETFPVRQVPGHQRVVPVGVSSTRQDSSLVVPVTTFRPSARYRLRLTAACSAADLAYADVTVSIDRPPHIAVFQVIPLQGVALQTQFNFSTERIAMSTCSFGFYPPSGHPLFFYTSAYSCTSQASLPACESYKS
ncbi:hypothetical protein J6590_056644 [Homalodisca vitripennis]|nr:hypothetical protein J6590_056644 [Homalodisca vitripennis]